MLQLFSVNLFALISEVPVKMTGFMLRPNIWLANVWLFVCVAEPLEWTHL